MPGDDEIEAITRLRRRYRLGTRVNGLAEDVNEARRLIVTGVGSLIVAYSVGYVDGDDEERRFFAYMSLFLFSMLLLVVVLLVVVELLWRRLWEEMRKVVCDPLEFVD